MSDQKQTVIQQVRADEVRVDDEYWYDGRPGPWLTITARRVESGIVGLEHEGFKGRGPTIFRRLDDSVLVRRPVPSGADALRESDEIAAFRECVEADDESLRRGERALGRILFAEIDRVRALAAPAVASSGAEGGLDGETFAVDILHFTRYHGGVMVEMQGTENYAGISPDELARLRAWLAAAPAPAVTDPEGERVPLLRDGAGWSVISEGVAGDLAHRGVVRWATLDPDQASDSVKR